MSNFQNILNGINAMGTLFVDNNNFRGIINNTLRGFFPKLIDQDINILLVFTIFLVDIIYIKYNINDDIYKNLLTYENNKDIKSIILLLLPFINDKDNNYLLNKLTDLNELLYKYPNRNIDKNILLGERKNILEEYFEFGNFSIGLIDKNDPNMLLNIINPHKLIYDIIYHNFLATIQTLEIMNGKYYINWVNIVPINLEIYKGSNLYRATINKIADINLNISSPITDTLYYSGLWFGDIYNIYRIKFFEEIKEYKWIIQWLIADIDIDN